MKKLTQDQRIMAKWYITRAALVLYDAFAVGIGLFLALVTRYYVASEFVFNAANHISRIADYAPFYVLICIAVFFAFKLYSGVWKYAGLNDLTRIVGANVICFVIHVVGTLAMGIRMPSSVYIISFAIQLVFVAAIRLSPRILAYEKKRIVSNRKDVTTHVMIVGVGGNSRTVLKELEGEAAMRPACILNYKGNSFGMLFDGVPMVNGIDKFEESLGKYNINCIIFASTLIPTEMKHRIKDVCRKQDIRTMELSEFLGRKGSKAQKDTAAEAAAGKQEAFISSIEIVTDGKTHKVANVEQMGFIERNKYIVRSINMNEQTLVIDLSSKAGSERERD